MDVIKSCFNNKFILFIDKFEKNFFKKMACLTGKSSNFILNIISGYG